MFKKTLLSGIVLSAFIISTNSAFAQETHYKEPLIRLSSHNIMHKKAKNAPCELDKSCENCKKTPCECQKPCQKPCDPCEKPKAAWKNSNCCDKDIKYLYEYFNKADCAVGLTASQQQKSNEIKANAAREITEIKREIATKQSQIMGAKNSQTCCNSKEIKKLNRDINKQQKKIKKIKKNAKRDYKKMLNGTQKQMYRNYKKAVKNKGLDTCCTKKEPCQSK